MYYSRSHLECRHCSRCGDALTDPASMERGVGPVCAKKDTHLFATTIATNFAGATMNVLAINALNLHTDVQPVFIAMRTRLFKRSERASNLAENKGEIFALKGTDCRDVAKQIDWMLSYTTPAMEKGLLIEIVKYLGFLGLASILSGKASTGEAEIKFDAASGKLSLVGSRCKAGWVAMRRIPGVVLPNYRTPREYTVPATEAKAFCATVMEFWPIFKGNIEAVSTEASHWAAANVVKAQAIAKASTMPQASIALRSQDFTVGFPWIRGETDRVVFALKSIASCDRSYDVVNKVWSFKLAHLARVREILGAVYTVTETNAEVFTTPATQYSRSSGGYRPRYNGRGFGTGWGR